MHLLSWKLAHVCMSWSGKIIYYRPHCHRYTHTHTHIQWQQNHQTHTYYRHQAMTVRGMGKRYSTPPTLSSAAPPFTETHMNLHILNGRMFHMLRLFYSSVHSCLNTTVTHKDLSVKHRPGPPHRPLPLPCSASVTHIRKACICTVRSLYFGVCYYT